VLDAGHSKFTGNSGAFISIPLDKAEKKAEVGLHIFLTSTLDE
jgi:hypothetical protein